MSLWAVCCSFARIRIPSHNMCSFFSAFVCTYWRTKMRNPTWMCWVLSLKRRSQLYFNLYLMFAKWQHILTKPNQNLLTHMRTYIHWKSTHNNKRGSSKCVGIVSVLLFVLFYSYFFVSYFLSHAHMLKHNTLAYRAIDTLRLYYVQRLLRQWHWVDQC